MKILRGARRNVPESGTRLRFSLILILWPVTCLLATERFVSLQGNGLAPFTSWDTAATNIQDAIDASIVGDVVWVSNGVYAVGGKTLKGTQLNRVSLDKAILVQSVGGASVTTIQGAWDPTSTNGPLSVRCAALTNGAVLRGFTLSGGASPAGYQQGGGGAFGASSNALVEDCIITRNAASDRGGGAYNLILSNCILSANLCLGYSGVGGGGGAANCNLNNSLITGNSAVINNGGGTLSCNLRNCAVTRNLSGGQGGGAFNGSLVNCTVTGNLITRQAPGYGGGVNSANLTNCIVYANQVPPGYPASNYFGCTMAYCCSLPLPIGDGNIGLDPVLVGDFHLNTNSPCLGAGTNWYASGVDIDGQPWASSPSIGCDEWYPEPAIAAQPLAVATNSPLGLVFPGLLVAGQQPFTISWVKDGAVIRDDPHYLGSSSANLLVQNFGPADAGSYYAVVSNVYGISTSAPVQVLVHCVAAGNTSPASPFSSWSTAATNIQDAIDAGADGEFVLVTNGLYSSGGKVIDGDLTNRVALKTRLTVASINGPATTIIQGTQDPFTTNGAAALRCAWLIDGSILRGFTLTAGATRTNLTLAGTLVDGGGVFATSTNAKVANCVISNNAAAVFGGGAFGATLERCRIISNRAEQRGGGAYLAMLSNCLLQQNSAGVSGAVDSGTLVNCTVVRNHADQSVGGVQNATAINCILYFNWDRYGPSSIVADASFGPSSYTLFSCVGRAVGWINVGVITNDPEILDGIHLSSTSPCRGTANPILNSGTDIDGEPWANPPSMGCDEFYEADCTGPLSVSASSQIPTVVQGANMVLLGAVTGRPTRLGWTFGDGTSVTNLSPLTVVHAWANPGDYQVTFTAFNLDNPAGVSTNFIVHILPWVAPALYGAGFNGTNYSFSFVTQPGAAYVVEQTTNLNPPIIWQTVGYISGTGSPVQAVDSAATDLVRFYRVRSR